MPGGLFTDTERHAFHPLEKLTAEEWAEKHRVLPPSSAEAGPLKLSRTPYMRGLYDALNEPGVEIISVLKSTQIAYSTFIESAIGYWIDADPGPILLCLDTEKALKETFDERIFPLINLTPVLKSRLSSYGHDTTLTSIKFDGDLGLFGAWSGSLSTLDRRSIRYALFDEADNYKNDAISRGIQRTVTFGHRRKILIGGCPVAGRQGNVWLAWEMSGDQRRFVVPCPHCGEHQALVFGQVKYPPLDVKDNARYAEIISQQQLAYYECEHCHQPIKDSQRIRMVSKGVWLSNGQSIDRSGQIAGNRPRSSRVGFWINCLYSPWVSFSAVAAKHRSCLNNDGNGDPVKMASFRNLWCAEPMEEVVSKVTVEDIRKLTNNAPRAEIVPSWAEFVIATADVQKDRIYWVVRAWGAGWKSQLIKYGLASSFENLRELTLNHQFKLERGGSSTANTLFIDSGYRGEEVMQFAKTDDRIKPTKGDNDNQIVAVKRAASGDKWNITIYRLNTQLLKDRLAIFRNEEQQRWFLNDAVGDEYLQHLASEQKQMINGKLIWEVKSNGLRNDYLDCEVLQLAAAEVAGVDTVNTSSVIETPQQQPMQPSMVQPQLYEECYEQKQSRWLGKSGIRF